MDRLARTGLLDGRYLVSMNNKYQVSLYGHTKICKRLFYTEGDDALDHRKSGEIYKVASNTSTIVTVRNSISVSVSAPVLLVGIYMYTGNDTDLLDESIEIVFDRGTTMLSLYKDNTLLSQAVR